MTTETPLAGRPGGARADETMITIWLAAACVTLALWFLTGQWRAGKGSGQLVLRILPTSLLFLTLPVPVTVWAMIRGFRDIAASGSGGVATVGPLCLAIVRASRAGAIAFLITIIIATLLQTFAGPDGVDAPRLATSDDAGSTWITIIAAASLLAIVPVGLLNYVTQGIPRLIMRAATPGAMVMNAERMSEVSATIASQSLLALMTGVLLTVVVDGLGGVNLVTARSRTVWDPLARASSFLLTATGGWIAWTVFRLGSDIEAFRIALP